MRPTQPRRDMSEVAGLLGATRLPTGAHRRPAGTDALTDLLVLRNRPAGALPLYEDWITTHNVPVRRGKARINAYFVAHLDRILGRLELGHGMYAADTLKVRPIAVLSGYSSEPPQRGRPPLCGR